MDAKRVRLDSEPAEEEYTIDQVRRAEDTHPPKKTFRKKPSSTLQSQESHWAATYFVECLIVCYCF